MWCRIDEVITLDLERIERVKTLAIIAMFSDDYLMERLVLKGGNAMDIVHKVSARASMDLDFSIAGEFSGEELGSIEERVQRVLSDTFREAGFEVFDVKFLEKPQTVTPDMADFWGGYVINFKIIETEKHEQLAGDMDSLRRQAAVVGWNRRRTLTIQISKFEYCQPKQQALLEGYSIFVYSPEMIALEKLRTICQQIPDYRESVKSRSRTARARDFVDIYVLIEHYRIDVTTPSNTDLLKRIFNAKRVPLMLLGEIEEYREYHRPDFAAVRDTVKPGTTLQDFDFYFDYVVSLCGALKSLWEE